MLLALHPPSVKTCRWCLPEVLGAGSWSYRHLCLEGIKFQDPKENRFSAETTLPAFLDSGPFLIESGGKI